MALKIWSAVMRGPTTSWMNNKFPKHTVSKQKTRVQEKRKFLKEQILNNETDKLLHLWVVGFVVGISVAFHGSLPSVPDDIQMLRHGVRILLRGLSEAC
ncbi:uncharacterized protein BO87DRAFT_399510 [Aspergillus neoniger CBS 115656]|uniref:Uncharacterized protein n=1 Tax=Aspergillus neoniger (strain CBS 115656) TaxID=1448310 RepID=A0A318YBN2_ASPNB|nr:hypothetical protein BO87DRAFT_399510 [Aspergillus neoniger CBS 115656]PYH31374.1 hypothetical protein BO87DRAFT_399510 [Aspergillus neoniger CBS 115656]